MNHFHKPLYISNGINNEIEGLKQALSLARYNASTLNILIICPDIPKELQNYFEQYATALKNQLTQTVRATCELLNIIPENLPVHITLSNHAKPVVEVVHHVLRHNYDLVIKEAESGGNSQGFKALDMSLLRKCPCPVWLCRPIAHHCEAVRVGVAIDPENSAPESIDLAIRLLQISRTIADSSNKELHIISCWDYEFEGYLRKNMWFEIPDAQLQETVNSVRSEHEEALKHLIHISKIGGNIRIHHIRGRADQVIPEYVKEQNINILVMGTLARTGIPGFIIGNTSENVVQKLTCSLVAMKPSGFVSPIKAY